MSKQHHKGKSLPPPPSRPSLKPPPRPENLPNPHPALESYSTPHISTAHPPLPGAPGKPLQPALQHAHHPRRNPHPRPRARLGLAICRRLSLLLVAVSRDGHQVQQPRVQPNAAHREKNKESKQHLSDKHPSCRPSSSPNYTSPKPTTATPSSSRRRSRSNAEILVDWARRRRYVLLECSSPEADNGSGERQLLVDLSNRSDEGGDGEGETEGNGDGDGGERRWECIALPTGWRDFNIVL
ncbi:hypothetical protein CONLIGDRAFT_638542 [Coniochaeta ligniaria NRRL 30616]|uniref:Uncharacterized protein n=1 Tax=Coniochaeta ligniaria NRRL 30616 TaxID=1408157 RepID=A0A1J7IZ52_9PEZI|nr:hypothetical protein CONLIGDRAFT_638542 [Coniochaeta ligniaria NRRL 30616]